MLDHSRELHKTKYSKFLVRPSPTKQNPKNIKNIFSLDKTQILQDINEIQKQQTILNDYDVCGDKQFKTTFIKTKKEKSLMNLHVHIFKKDNDQGQIDSPQKANVHFNNSTITLFNKQPTAQIKQTIYMNSNHHQTFLSTLHKTQKNIMTRERKTLQKFKETQREWQKIDSYLKLKQPKSETVTFGSVKKVYVHENPEKLELINDVLPKYWQYSLRNGDKTLKSYIKGNHFKPEIAEQMLQTLKGTKKLEQSIPIIDSERVNKEFVKTDKIRLKAFSMQRQANQETMRSFHKNMYQTLNRTMRERVSEQQGSTITSHNKSKVSSSRESNLMKETLGTSKEQSEAEMKEDLDVNTRRVYEFCEALQNLDKVDNEVYIKKYDRKRKWLHEGLEIGEL